MDAPQSPVLRRTDRKLNACDSQPLVRRRDGCRFLPSRLSTIHRTPHDTPWANRPQDKFRVEADESPEL